MKNSEKNSSKVNTNNNEVLSVETIKAQLKAACANMTAKETKDYIKSLDGYELKLTGQKPAQHYTVFFGDVRICNVEQVQGIKADGTSRGCVSTAKVNFSESMCKVMLSKYDKIKDNLTEDEDIKILTKYQEIEVLYNEIQGIFDAANERAAAVAKEAAKAKREEAAKERATKKVGEKIAAGTDSEKIAAIAAALNVSYEVAATIYKEQKQTA